MEVRSFFMCFCFGIVTTFLLHSYYITISLLLQWYLYIFFFLPYSIYRLFLVWFAATSILFYFRWKIKQIYSFLVFFRVLFTIREYNSGIFCINPVFLSTYRAHFTKYKIYKIQNFSPIQDYKIQNLFYFLTKFSFWNT